MDENFEATGKVKIKLPKGLAAPEPDLRPEPEPKADSVVPPSAVIKAKSVNLQEFLDQSLADMKLQLSYYQNICTRIAGGEWRVIDVVDYLFLLVKSLGFDAVSLLLLDSEHPGAFLPMVSRGYHHPPALNLEDYWRAAICADGEDINWDALLALAQRGTSPAADWIETEKFFRIGYSPIQDGERIVGFMVIVSYAEKRQSPLASVLLELCGGHIGLALAARRAKGRPVAVGGSESAVRETLVQLKNLFSQLPENGIDVSPMQLNETIEQSRKLIDRALLLEGK